MHTLLCNEHCCWRTSFPLRRNSCLTPGVRRGWKLKRSVSCKPLPARLGSVRRLPDTAQDKLGGVPKVPWAIALRVHRRYDRLFGLLLAFRGEMRGCDAC
jgi:hypothetical protein